MPLDPRELARIAGVEKSREEERVARAAVEARRSCHLAAERRLPALLTALDGRVEEEARSGHTKVDFRLDIRGASEPVLADFLRAFDRQDARAIAAHESHERSACHYHTDALIYSAKEIETHFRSLGFKVRNEIRTSLDGATADIEVAWD